MTTVYSVDVALLWPLVQINQMWQKKHLVNPKILSSMSSVLSLMVDQCFCFRVETFLLFHPHGCIQTSLREQLLVPDHNGLWEEQKGENGVREERKYHKYQNYAINSYVLPRWGMHVICSFHTCFLLPLFLKCSDFLEKWRYVTDNKPVLQTMNILVVVAKGSFVFSICLPDSILFWKIK